MGHFIPNVRELENGHVKLTNLGYDRLKGQKSSNNKVIQHDNKEE